MEILYFITCVIGIVLGLVWLVFPFLVLNRLNRIDHFLQTIDQKLFVIATNSNEQTQRVP